MVFMRTQTIGSNNTQRPGDKKILPLVNGECYGQHLSPTQPGNLLRAFEDDDGVKCQFGVPASSSSATGAKDNGDRQSKSKTVEDKVRKGVETFGAGPERGVEERIEILNESDRKGRTHRR